MLRVGLRARIRASALRLDHARPLIWLHAPSVGEGLQARPVLQALRRLWPEAQLAYTWFSPSAEGFAARLQADGLADLVEVLPFDGAADAQLMLDCWRPAVLAFVKLDVWPVLAEAAQSRGVPTTLISASLAPNSGRQGRLARAVLGDAYRGLAAVGAIAQPDAERLTALGVRPERLSVTGDTRMDQVAARAASIGADHPVRRLIAGPGPVLVAGSTWPADEAVLLPAVLDWLAANPTARLIIAPHEPTEAHLAPIRRWADAAGLELTTLAKAEAERDHSAPSGEQVAPIHASVRVLLVDTVGTLGDLYALADMAFVGGGFHDAGLHSVLEPAAYGVPVLFGPRHGNAREAGALVERAGARVVRDTDSLRVALTAWTAHPESRREAGAAAKAFVTENLGSTERVVRLLETLLER